MSVFDQRGDHTARGFAHHAWMYADAGEFVSEALSFIHDGLAAGDPTLVMVKEPTLGSLRTALNGDAGVVEFVDMELVGKNPARVIPAWQEFIDRNDDNTHPLRGISEPIWAGRNEAELAECHLHESLLKIAFADTPRPFWMLCPYHANSLHPSVTTEAHRHHDIVHRPDDRDLNRSPDEIPPYERPLPSRPDDCPLFPLELTSLGELRRRAAAAATSAGLPSDRVSDFVLAANELATNSLIHGNGTGAACFWHDEQTLFAEFLNPGRISDPLAGRVRPAGDNTTGRGLWIVNQVVDLHQQRTTPTGMVTRIHMQRA